MESFKVGEIVWARVSGHVFWPAEVIEDVKELTKLKRKSVIACVEFLGSKIPEREAITDPRMIHKFNSEKTQKFIIKGQSKGVESRLLFDNALNIAQKRQGFTNSDCSKNQLNKAAVTCDKSDSLKNNKSVAGLALESSPVKFVADKDTKVISGIKRRYTKSAKCMKKCLTDDTYIRKRLRNRPVRNVKEQISKITHSEGIENNQGCIKNSSDGQENIHTLQLIKQSKVKKHEKDCWIAMKSKDDLDLIKLSVEKTNTGIDFDISSFNGKCDVEHTADKRIKIQTVQSSLDKNDRDDDDDSEDDDDLPEVVMTPVKQDKDFNIESGDITWAKYRLDAHWPAQVIKVHKGKKKPIQIYVKFFAYTNGRFKIQPKNICSFTSEKREIFISQGEEFYKRVESDLKLFREAVQEAEGLLRKRALGIPESIYHEEDLKALETMDSEENTDEEDSWESVNDDVMNEMCKSNSSETSTSNSPLLRRSERKRSFVTKYNDIMSYIKGTKNILLDIQSGKKWSKRHGIFHGQNAEEKQKLMESCGFGPIADEDVCGDVVSVVNNWYREFVSDSLRNMNYIYAVWIPEAIIYALKSMENISYANAEDIYNQGCKDPSLVESLHENFKKNKLTQEQKDKCLARAERKVAYMVSPP